ncbi:MAG: hypothetical protein R6V83_06670 [Candidatus Thorarchaeota archaeon]
MGITLPSRGVNPLLVSCKQTGEQIESNNIESHGFVCSYGLKGDKIKIGMRFYDNGRYTKGYDKSVRELKVQRNDVSLKDVLDSASTKGYASPSIYTIVQGEKKIPAVFTLSEINIDGSQIDLNALVGRKYSQLRKQVTDGKIPSGILVWLSTNGIIKEGSTGRLEPNDDFIIEYIDKYSKNKITNLPEGIKKIEDVAGGPFSYDDSVELDINLEEETLRRIATKTIGHSQNKPEFKRVHVCNDWGGTVDLMSQGSADRRTNSYMAKLYDFLEYLRQNKGKTLETKTEKVYQTLTRTLIESRPKGIDNYRIARGKDSFLHSNELLNTRDEIVFSLMALGNAIPGMAYDNMEIRHVLPALAGVKLNADDSLIGPEWDSVIDKMKKWAPGAYADVMSSLYGGAKTTRTGTRSQLLLQEAPIDHNLKVRSWVIGDEIYVQVVDHYYVSGKKGDNLLMAGGVEALDGFSLQCVFDASKIERLYLKIFQDCASLNTWMNPMSLSDCQNAGNRIYLPHIVALDPNMQYRIALEVVAGNMDREELSELGDIIYQIMMRVNDYTKKDIIMEELGKEFSTEKKGWHLHHNEPVYTVDGREFVGYLRGMTKDAYELAAVKLKIQMLDAAIRSGKIAPSKMEETMEHIEGLAYEAIQRERVLKSYYESNKKKFEAVQGSKGGDKRIKIGNKLLWNFYGQNDIVAQNAFIAIKVIADTDISEMVYLEDINGKPLNRMGSYIEHPQGIHSRNQLKGHMGLVTHFKPAAAKMVGRTTMFRGYDIRHIDEGDDNKDYRLGAFKDDKLEYYVDWSVTDTTMHTTGRRSKYNVEIDGVVSYDSRFLFTVKEPISENTICGFEFYVFAQSHQAGGWHPDSINYEYLKNTPAGLFSILMDKGGAAMGVSRQPAIMTEGGFELHSRNWKAQKVKSLGNIKFFSVNSISELFDAGIVEKMELWKHIVEHSRLNPGPYTSGVDIDLLHSWISWYRNRYDDSPHLFTRNIPVQVEQFDTLGIQEDLQSSIASWFAELLHNDSMSDTLKEIKLQSVAYKHMGLEELCDDWAYPPYQIAEWRYTGMDEKAWYTVGDKSQALYTARFGTTDITQTVNIDIEPDRTMKVDKIQLFLTELGDIYNNTVEFRVEVSDGSDVVTGSTILTKEGAVDIPLDRQLEVSDGDTLYVTIPIQDTTGRTWLFDSNMLSRLYKKRAGQFEVDGRELPGHSMYVSIHDAEKASIIGWQKTGTRFETGIDDDVNMLIGDGINFLNAHFTSYPEDKLPRTIIAATNFDSETNTTYIKYEEYKYEETQIYSDIPGNRAKETPIYVYGKELPVDYIGAGLSISGYPNVKSISHSRVIELVYGGEPGVLVINTEMIPSQLLAVNDKGIPKLREWINAGNQVVSAGVLPFSETIVNGELHNTYDFLFHTETSTVGTDRLVELSYQDEAAAVWSDPIQTYQCENPGEANETHVLDLDGENDDWISLSGNKRNEDGSVTFVFAMALDDINGTSKQYQTFDLFVDGIPIFSNFATDQLCYLDGGLDAGSKVFYDEYMNNRMFVQHIENVPRSTTSDVVYPNYLCYLTVRESLNAGPHTVTIADNPDNKGSQELRILDLNNILAYEYKHHKETLLAIESQYQGMPEIGAGVYAVTGKDMVRWSEDVGRESFTMQSMVGLEPTRTVLGVDLSEAHPYRTYAKDITNSYGECSVKVGAGMFTMLDLYTYGLDSYWHTLAELNYVLTGVVADWYKMHDQDTETDFSPGAGDDFEGLLVDVGVPSISENVPGGLVPEQDAKANGTYANSFEETEPLETTNADLVWDDGRLLVNSTTQDTFSVDLDTAVEGYDYLMFDISMFNCTVSLNSTQVLGEAQPGLNILKLPEGPYDNITLVATRNTGSASGWFRIEWISTSEVPALAGPSQLYIQQFTTSTNLTTTGFEDDTLTIADGNMILTHGHDGDSEDNDSVHFNLAEPVHGAGLLLDMKHHINTTSTTGVELQATLYSQASREGNQQTISLDMATTSIIDRNSLTLETVSSIELSVVSQISSLPLNWTVDYLEIVEDGDVALDTVSPLYTETTGAVETITDETLTIRSDGTTTAEVYIPDIEFDLGLYPYTHVRVSNLNLTSASIRLCTSNGNYTHIITDNETTVFTDDVDSGTIVSGITLLVGSDGLNRTMTIDDLVFSPIQEPIDERVSVQLEYSTQNGDTLITLDDYLMDWGTGTLALSNDTESVTRAETQIVEWNTEYIALRQDVVNRNVSVNAVFHFDGIVDVSVTSADYGMTFALNKKATKYSDSFGVMPNNVTEEILRSPTFAALYSYGIGFGVTGISTEQVSAFVGQSSFTVSAMANESIMLLPVLAERFELIDGVEIDPNFVVDFEDIDITGLLDNWDGTLESLDVAYWHGAFKENYALKQTFLDTSYWIVDNTGHDMTTDEALDKTKMGCTNGKMNITVNANQSALAETVVLNLNYLSIDSSAFPFMRLVLDGTGHISVSVKLNLTDGTTSHIFHVTSITPEEPTSDERNLYVQLIDDGCGYEEWTIQGIELWMNETDTSTVMNKSRVSLSFSRDKPLVLMSSFGELVLAPRVVRR